MAILNDGTSTMWQSKNWWLGCIGYNRTLSFTPPVEPSQGITCFSDSCNYHNDILIPFKKMIIMLDTWLRVTDHMTYNATDFSKTTPPKRRSIANTNEIASPCHMSWDCDFCTHFISTYNLLVSSLSHKLLSINQVSADLNFVAIIYHTFFLLQDILTKEIIVCDTRRGILYYMDDFSKG